MKRSIFISYSRDDREFARKLARDLKDRDVDVWLDEWEIKVGDLLTSRIGDAIKESSYFGIVLTPSSVKKPWVETELNAALIKELKSKRVTVLPILKQKCEMPTLLWGKKYADFRTDYEKGLTDLLRVFAPTVHLPPLSFDHVVHLKDELKHVPSGILLANGAVLVGVIAGISKSRKTVGIDPLHSSPTERHFPAMHPNETTYWVDVDSSLVADMWPLEAPIVQEFEASDERQGRREPEHIAWQNEPGWTPWHFYDETCHRLKAVAKKEHFTALVPMRDLAAMGPRPYRYGGIRATGYMPLYCDWWYLDRQRHGDQQTSSTITYKQRMDMFFDARRRTDFTPFFAVAESVSPREEQIRELENDDWALMLCRVISSVNPEQVPSEIVPVALRWRSMFFSPAALSRIVTPFCILGEAVNHPIELENGTWPSYVKARGAFFSREERKHDRH